MDMLGVKRRKMTDFYRRIESQPNSAERGAAVEQSIKAAESRAAESRAADCRAAESRATDHRTAESRAAESRAAESRAAESRAAEIPAESRAAESRAAEIPEESRAAESRATDHRTAESRAAESRAAESRAAESRAAEIPAESRAAESRAAEIPAESRAAESRAAEIPAESRAAESRAAEIPAESRAAESRAAEIPEESRAAESDERSDIRRTPNRPNIQFPKTSFGSAQRSFRYAWFKEHPWLEWDSELNKAFCHTCRMSEKLDFLTFSKCREEAFTTQGFSRWNRAYAAFRAHEKSSSHREAELKFSNYLSSSSVLHKIQTKADKECKTARTALLKILESLLFLARQDIAIRGHSDDQSNLNQLLKMRATDSKELAEWLTRKEKWLGHDVQNEMIEMLAHACLRAIAEEVNSNIFFSLIVDETTDCTNKEQVTLILRHVSENLEVSEDFLGLYNTDKTDAATLTKIIKDVLLRLNIPLENCRGQCYDGASAMSGRFTGVQARIKMQTPNAFFVHCSAHVLNLVLQEATRDVHLVRNTIDLVQDLVSFVRDSPHRLAAFQNLQEGGQSALRPLCPTRWTMRASSIRIVLENVKPLHEALVMISDSDRGKAGSKACGLAKQLKSFEFLFGLLMCEKVFSKAEMVSKVLQGKNVTISEAKEATDCLKKNMERMRSDSCFANLWQECAEHAEDLDIDIPSLPRAKKLPKRLISEDHEERLDPTVLTVERTYREKHWEPLLSKMISTLEERFHTLDTSVVSCVERLLVDGIRGEKASSTEDLDTVVKNYSCDIDVNKLKVQLSMLPDLVSVDSTLSNGLVLKSTITAINKLGDAARLFSEIRTLLKIILVLPSSSASAERSFSALRRLKTYLRSTMTQARLNHLLILHVQQKQTQGLDLYTIAKQFASRSAKRQNAFGEFTKN